MEIELSSSAGNFKLHEKLELQEFKDKYVIKSVENPDQGFLVGRHDGNIEPLNGKGFVSQMLLFCVLCLVDGQL